MNRSRVFAVACALVAAPCFAQLTVGPNVNISKRTGNQSEGAIAVNPTNPMNLFCLSNVDSGNFLFGAVSMDGGLTWASRNVATGSDGLTSACCDPSLSFDDFGNLYICYINASTNAVIVGLSTNGGVSFTTLATFTGSIDQPTVVAASNSVWVVYNLSGSSAARGALVSGLGSVGAFSAAQTAPSSSGGNFGDITIGGAGQVVITYQNPSSGQGPATIFTNTDSDGLGAGGFGARVTVTSTNVGGFDAIPPQPNRTVDAEAGLGYDRSGGAHNGRLYMVYTDEVVNENNDLDIKFRFSDDNGATWSSAVRVNDDSVGHVQFFPKMAVDKVTGHVAIVWYDTRNDPNNILSEIWGTASLDGGATFLANVKISAGASDGRQAHIGDPNEFGDYIGLTMYNDVFYPIWADDANITGDNPNGTAKLDMYTAKVTISAQPPMGACCAADGTCQDTTQAGCQTSWMIGVPCLPNNPCPQPMGACCAADGTCKDTTQAGCQTSWMIGVPCLPNNPCPQPMGACCVMTACSITSQAGCGGTWQGAATVCGTQANPTTCCPANFNGVGGVTVQDLFDFLTAYFAGLPSADFNHVGGVTPQDLFDYLKAFFAGC